MRSKSFRYTRTLGWLGAAALLTAAPLSNTWAADPGKDGAERWAQHRQEWVQAKLDRDANRLEIAASQQTAWQAYAGARKALAERTVLRPAQGADAATIAKNRADRAAEGARKLAALADATTKLQTVLSPQQRETLNQIARSAHHRHGEHGHGYREQRHRGWHDGPEGIREDGQTNVSDQGPREESPSV